MAATYDPTTDRGKVRLLISDVGGQDSASFLFTDVEIDTFLQMRSDVRLAAALALRAIAANETQVLKRITYLDLSTDGPAVARELRASADSYEAQADEDTDFDIAEMDVNQFVRRDLRSWW